VARLRTNFEKHDVLEVLLVDQCRDLLEHARKRIHHDEERRGALDEALAYVKVALLNLNVEFPVAEIFHELEFARHFQKQLHV